MDTKLTDDIVGCRHHASLIGIPSNDDRLALEFRPIALFDRGVKGVHVGVDDHSAPIAIATLLLSDAQSWVWPTPAAPGMKT